MSDIERRYAADALRERAQSLAPTEKAIVEAVINPIADLCAKLSKKKFLAVNIGDAIELVAKEHKGVHLFAPQDGHPPTGNPGLSGPTRLDLSRLTEPTARFPGNGIPSVGVGEEIPNLVDVKGTSVRNSETHSEILKAGAFDSFSGKVTYGTILPGTVLCRYAQQADQNATYPTEPGRFWVDLADLSLNEKELRTNLALPPSWNQDGILEAAVIREGGVSGYWGTCASQPADPANLGSGYLPGGVKQYIIPRANLPQLDGCIMVIPDTKMPIADASHAQQSRKTSQNTHSVRHLFPPRHKETLQGTRLHRAQPTWGEIDG
jgi:hypothetical protein